MSNNKEYEDAIIEMNKVLLFLIHDARAATLAFDWYLNKNIEAAPEDKKIYFDKPYVLRQAKRSDDTADYACKMYEKYKPMIRSILDSKEKSCQNY